ncbi:MAG: MafI family immunity protein [Actinobacteria bacterium]|nr:MafI family immunity protein [Actinomycetota bacterium]
MRTPSPEEMTVRLHEAMDAAVGLTPDDIINVQSLIEVGEWLVAFETLCTQIYEWEIGLEPDVIRDLEGLGAALGARKKLTDHLWEDAADA